MVISEGRNNKFSHGCELLLAVQLSDSIKRQRGSQVRRVGWAGNNCGGESVSRELEARGLWALGSGGTSSCCFPPVLSGFLLEIQRECTRSPSPKAFPAYRVGGKWAKAEKGCVAVPKLYLWEGVREKMLCNGNETR